MWALQAIEAEMEQFLFQAQHWWNIDENWSCWLYSWTVYLQKARCIWFSNVSFNGQQKIDLSILENGSESKSFINCKF